MFGHDKKDSAKGQSGARASGQPETKPLPEPDRPTSLNLRKPLPAKPHTASTSRIADIPGMTPPRSEVRPYGVEGKTLVVGREISLAGQIAACDKLVVEGSVEADLEGCRQLDISPTGHFKGSAEIEEAEISGRFDGGLTVTKRLRVRSTARIVGTIEYGQIEIEAGGEVSGDVRVRAAKAQEGPSAPEAPKTAPLVGDGAT
ncbi:MAG: polymer-forming cytoskeletal protein [Alphaproteobacteria bacterium]|nr:polymer-forming cytoskeletal protein [Alphaproteobacteria bacterium]